MVLKNCVRKSVIGPIRDEHAFLGESTIELIYFVFHTGPVQHNLYLLVVFLPKITKYLFFFNENTNPYSEKKMTIFYQN